MSPVEYVHATCSSPTFFLLIWSSDEYCDESDPPKYSRHSRYVLDVGLPFCWASGTATSANPITRARRFIVSPAVRSVRGLLLGQRQRDVLRGSGILFDPCATWREQTAAAADAEDDVFASADFVNRGSALGIFVCRQITLRLI